MKLEDQVCSLELAKRLKALGVKQESAFYFYGDGSVQFGKAMGWTCSAFTVAELGEMLPVGYPFLTSFRLPKDYGVGDMNGKWTMTRGGKVEVLADTEAEARAKMLIYLIENGLEKGLVKP